jgi:hypothetical protein
MTTQNKHFSVYTAILVSLLAVFSPQILRGGNSLDSGLRKTSKTFKTVSLPPPSVYYVSPNGNDDNTGTITAPFRTWQKAHDMTQPGDTVWVRGGTYLVNSASRHAIIMKDHNGTPTQRIYFWAYPGEKPVLDCSGITAIGQTVGIAFHNSWWHIKGLELTHMPMKRFEQDYVRVFKVFDGSNNIFEQIDAHHNDGSGFVITGNSKNNLILNSDFHHNYDLKSRYRDGTPATGENANGLDFFELPPTSTGNVVRGCRAWSNSDDGFDFWDANAGVLLENCWSFWNGYIPDTRTPIGNGTGFKMGRNQTGNHKTQNCLAFENKANGFDDNSTSVAQTWYNNTAYNNGGDDFAMFQSVNHVLRNNVAARNNVNLIPTASDVANSWSLSNVMLTDADFQSVNAIGAACPFCPS